MYTSVLRDWTGYYEPRKKEFRLTGRVYGDAKRRVTDGTLINTSPIDFIEDTTVGKVAISTSGVRYLLVG